jgi:large subunit ribosomal protein L19
MSKIVDEISKRSNRNADAVFEIGDTVDVHVRILEGDKERIQVYTGAVVGRVGGGAGESFTVRRLVQGEGVERVFPLHSPLVEKIVVRKTGRVRRAKLTYLRGRTGKATRLAERRDVIATASTPTVAVKDASAAEKPPEA